jgi:tetratricopeptide (TPR) repeat protein
MKIAHLLLSVFLFLMVSACQTQQPMPIAVSPQMPRCLQWSDSPLGSADCQIPKLPTKDIQARERGQQGFDVTPYWNAARRALKEEKPLQAWIITQQALNFLPGHSEVWNLKALAEQRLGFDQDAQASWKKALEWDPANVAARLNRGFHSLKWSFYLQALSDFQTILQREPGHAEAALGDALVGMAQGDIPNAHAKLQEIVAANPENALGLLNLAALEGRALGNPSRAKEYAQRFLALQRMTPDIFQKSEKLMAEMGAQLSRGEDVQAKREQINKQ